MTWNMKSGGNRPRLRLTACARARYLHTVKGGRVPIEHDLLSADRHTNGPFSRRQQHASIPKPAGVGMRPFPVRLNASLCLFGIQIRAACVYYGVNRLASNSACVIFGFGEPGACVHFAFRQASMRPFPAGHASISASAERELAFISGSDERGMRLYRARFDPGMRPFQVGTIPACVHYGFGHPGLASIFDSARPACVHCARGMHQFPSRLNAGLRLLRSRLNRLASNSRRACVYFLAG